jgi:hypothetical protein
MPASEGGGSSFQVHLSGAIAQRLRQVQHQANLEGRGLEALSAFREMVRRLRRDPMDVGEPLYRLPALRMQVRQVAIRPLFIDFAVCEDRPLVILRGVTLLSRREL